MTPIILAVGLLATFRLTRIVTDDTITETARRRLAGVHERSGAAAPHIERPGVFFFITCPWCTSIWIGAGVAALLWAWPAETIWPAAALSFSAAAGLLARWGGD